MVLQFRRDLDPLDLEVVERAFEVASDAIKTKATFDPDSDEALEAAMRRELVEMICSTGVSDPEALLDILFADFSDRDSSGPQFLGSDLQKVDLPIHK
jgi:hypothetical protein